MQSFPLSPVPSEKLLGPGHGPGVWPLRERLALASALLDVDNQNTSWPGISRQLIRFTTPGRPESWCSARACAKQYALLLDAVELTRRQKTPAEQSRMHILHATHLPAPTTPGLSVAERLVKRLTAEHVDELRARIRLGQKYYSFFKQFLVALESGKLDSQLSTLEQLIHSGSGSSTSHTSIGISTVQTAKGKSEVESLMCGFKQLWPELDTVYAVPDSTWICPSGPGSVATGSSGVTGATGAIPGNSGGSKSSGTAGTASMNRLCALLAEASSAIRTPCRENRRRTKNGRARPLGWIRPHLEGTGVVSHTTTATTRAAVATRQRYLSTANKKRVGTQNNARQTIGRRQKYPRVTHRVKKELEEFVHIEDKDEEYAAAVLDGVEVLLESIKAAEPVIYADDGDVDPQGPNADRAGQANLESDAASTRGLEVETADEFYSSDMLDDRSEKPNYELNSGASTPSTAAMYVSDTDEIMPEIEDLGEEDREELIATPSMKFDDGEVRGTSPGTVSSISGPEQSVSTRDGETISHYPSADDEEPMTPAMCESERVSTNSFTSSQSTEAAGDQYSDEICDTTERDQTATLIVRSSFGELENESERPIADIDGVSPVPILEDSDDQTIRVDIDQSITEPRTADIPQSPLHTEAHQDPIFEVMPCMTEPQSSSFNNQAHSPVVVHSPANADQPLNQMGSPLATDSREQSSNGSVEPIPNQDRSIHSIPTPNLSEEPAEETEVPAKDPHFSESVHNDHLLGPQSPLKKHTPISDESTSYFGSPLRSQSTDEAKHVVVATSSHIFPSTNGSVSPFSPEPEKHLSGLSSPLVESGFSLHEPDTRQTFADLAQFHSSSTPSGRELAIELSPANLEGYNTHTSLGSDNSPDLDKPCSRKKQRRGRPRHRSSCKQLMSEMLSKGSPVVELSHLMLPFSSPECGGFSVDLQARVTLEPISFHYPVESPRQISVVEHSPTKLNNPITPKSPGLRLRFCRQGSKLTVVQSSLDPPVVNANRESDTTWCNEVLDTAEQALNEFTSNCSSEDSSDEYA
ncbi:Bromodomain containing protein 8 [Fasciola hepatica]|uniref:Bromodomain containing protein 8 n=1 Tax=Fasciola hepatica TaxID=6192 RepID=A0A4E0RHM0_FASHE|nr:Bromodomain containing protein 8 [Fasciola hepatica]